MAEDQPKIEKDLGTILSGMGRKFLSYRCEEADGRHGFYEGNGKFCEISVWIDGSSSRSRIMVEKHTRRLSDEDIFEVLFQAATRQHLEEHYATLPNRVGSVSRWELHYS